MINCKNGMLDPLTGDLLPHSQHYLSTTQVPVEWDPSAECPHWEAWLAERQPEPEVQQQISEIFGDILVRAKNYHKFFFWFGEGSTGKSTTVNVLKWLLGKENIAALRLEELDQGFVRGSMVGKALYLADEVSKNSFQHEGIIKTISSGDLMHVDVKYAQPFSFEPNGRLLMTSNVHAYTKDISDGFRRRFLQTEWQHPIPEGDREYGYEDRVFRPELKGILRWAIDGYRSLTKRGEFGITQQNKDARMTFGRHLNSVVTFLEDSEWVIDMETESVPGVEVISNEWITVEALLDHYHEWAEYHGINAFCKDVSHLGRELGNKRPDLRERGRKKKRLMPGTSPEFSEHKTQRMSIRGFQLRFPQGLTE